MLNKNEMLANTNKVRKQATESEMIQQNESENAAQAASVEPKQWAKDMGIKGTRVKAIINGDEVEFIVAHTEYDMRHDKKMNKLLETAELEKSLKPNYHFCSPEIFWDEGYELFDNNNELIERGTQNVRVQCQTPETIERIYIEDILEHVVIHDFKSVAEYAQHIGMTITLSRMPSKVEEMGISAMATGDQAMKEAYEFAIDNGMNYTSSLGYLGGEIKASTTKHMMRGCKPPQSLELERTREEAQTLYDEARAAFGEGEAKKRYIPRALNIVLNRDKCSFDIVIEALRTLPASEATRLRIIKCDGKEGCIAGALITWIKDMQRNKEQKAAA